MDNGPPKPSLIFRAAFTRRSERVSLTTDKTTLNLHPSHLDRTFGSLPRRPPIRRTNLGLSTQASYHIFLQQLRPQRMPESGGLLYQ